MTGSARSEDGIYAPGDRAAAPAAGHLALLDALLDVAGDIAAFAPLLAVARSVFACDRAMVLREDGDVLRCVAADPEQAQDQRWPAPPALMQAARNRVLVL